MEQQTITYNSKAEWEAEAKKRFGSNWMEWKFVCPACHYEQTPADYKEAGLKSTMVAFSCVGRGLKNRREAFAKGKGPCNYAGGGLFRLNPVTVIEEGEEHHVFDFAKS